MAQQSGGITKLVSRGIPADHSLAQTVGDGLSSPGRGREEEQRGSLDAQSAGGYGGKAVTGIPLIGDLLKRSRASGQESR